MKSLAHRLERVRIQGTTKQRPHRVDVKFTKYVDVSVGEYVSVLVRRLALNHHQVIPPTALAFVLAQ